jgi:serine/threonine protein kinase
MSKDRYEILGTLGCGATSRVDKARDTVLGRTVALKTLVHAFGAAVEQKQFLREAQIVSQLSHPAIINLYDVGIEDGNVAYLVMEYVSGKTLQQVLSQSAIPVPRACAWAAELAGALGRAHRAGILHGDVKPGNILINEDGNVKLGDFGIARFATQVSGSGRLMGTPAYLSPEQIQGETQNTRSDLFSLGVVLYQMVTGVPPFDGSSVGAVVAQILSAEPVPPSQRNPAVPPGLDRVILRCLAKSPADRYPSAEALAASLYPFARDTWDSAASAATPVTGAKKKPWFFRPVGAHEAWTWAAALLVLAASIPAYRSFARAWHVPPPPVSVTIPPRPPADMLGYSISHTWDDLEPSTEEAKRERPEAPFRRQPSEKAGRARVVASAPQSQPKRTVVPAKSLAAASSLTAPDFSAPPPGPISQAADRAALHIEIDSIVGEGALAIFADQNLVFTTELRAGAPGKPLRLERSLPAGPHALRVALYRPDKSLQIMKEGLGEIHGDSVNTLRIHVGRKSKMLVRRETSLDVVWPSAVAPASGGAAPASYSASVK